MRYSIVSGFVVMAGLAVAASPCGASDGTVVAGGDVSLTVSPGGAVTGVAVEGRMLPAGPVPGGVVIRDLTEAGHAGSVLLAEGWEDAGTGWQPHPGNGRIVFTRSDEDAATGRWSLLARLDDADAIQAAFFLSQPVDVVPGTTVRLQGRWKATRGYLGADPGSLPLQRDAFLVPPGVRLSGLEVVPCSADGSLQPEGRTHLATFRGQAPDWKPVGAEWTVPPGVEHVRVAVSAVLDPEFGDEAFLVDDIELFPLPVAPRRLEGEAVAVEGGVTVEGTVGSIALDVTWRHRAGAVEAVVDARATDGASHAFDLVMAVPVDAVGWAWLDDQATERMITEPIPYAFTATADIDAWLPVSIYPYGGITDGTSGIAAGVPLDLPVPVLIRYDGSAQLLEVVWHLGLDPSTGHDAATVSARFFAFDPRWGFRSIIERYHDTWLDRHSWFETRFDPSPFETFHQNHYQGERGARACAAEEASRVLSLEYTVPDLVVEDVAPAGGAPPDYPGLLALVEARAGEGPECQRTYYGPAFAEVATDATAAPVLKYVGVRPWTGGRAQAVFKLAPLRGGDVEGYWTWLSRCFLLPAFEATASPDPSWNPPVPPSTVDGVSLDNFGAHVSADLDPDHMRLVPGPLTWSPAGYRPALFLPASYRVHMEQLRRFLDTLPPPVRAIVFNWKGLGIVNADLPLADLCGDETDDYFSGGVPGRGAETAWAPWFLRYKRALAYHKLRGTAFSGNGVTRLDVERTLASAVLWATVARFKFETVFDGITAEEADALCRAGNRLVLELQRAGWEPVTRARASDPRLLVERYGGPPEPFFLVVQNTAGTALTGEVRLEAALGVTGLRAVDERRSGAPVTVSGEGPEWVLGLPEILPGDAVVLEVTPAPPAPRDPAGRVRGTAAP